MHAHALVALPAKLVFPSDQACRIESIASFSDGCNMAVGAAAVPEREQGQASEVIDLL